jgi:hypothetical protein
VPALLSIGIMLGGFVVVATSIGLPTAAGWIAFGISIALAGAGLALGAVGTCGTHIFAVVGGSITALATWTVVASAFFETATVRWVALGSGVGYVVESLVALIAHELSPARVVHVLEVRGNPARF